MMVMMPVLSSGVVVLVMSVSNAGRQAHPAPHSTRPQSTYHLPMRKETLQYEFTRKDMTWKDNVDR